MYAVNPAAVTDTTSSQSPSTSAARNRPNAMIPPTAQPPPSSEIPVASQPSSSANATVCVMCRCVPVQFSSRGPLVSAYRPREQARRIFDSNPVTGPRNRDAVACGWSRSGSSA